MERNAVLAKTPKGQAEIKSRTHGLARKLRAILIMVDGSATAGEILAKCGGTPDAETALASLVGQGFVEVRGANAAVAASPAAASPDPPPVDVTQPTAIPATATPDPPAADVTQPLPIPAAAPAPPLDATQPMPIPAASPAPPLGATQPIPIPAAPAQPREEAMAALLRFLADNLGAGADVPTGALERARTREDFHVVAERCAHALAAAHGASTAQAFRDRARAYVDAYLAG
jgi:hypothetical protein